MVESKGADVTVIPAEQTSPSRLTHEDLLDSLAASYHRLRRKPYDPGIWKLALVHGSAPFAFGFTVAVLVLAVFGWTVGLVAATLTVYGRARQLRRRAA